jgi:hypothetical protein
MSNRVPPAGRTTRLCSVIVDLRPAPMMALKKGRCEVLPSLVHVTHKTSSAGGWFYRAVGFPLKRSLHEWTDYTNVAERGEGNH